MTTNADGTQSMFILTVFEKKKKKKIYQGSVTLLQMMTNYQKARVKLTNTQLRKLKSAVKNKTGIRLISN